MWYRGKAWISACLGAVALASIFIGDWWVAAACVATLVIWRDAVFLGVAVSLAADLTWLVPGDIVHHPPLFTIVTFLLILARRIIRQLT